jgi:biofilm PGA synthesis protein PgaA
MPLIKLLKPLILLISLHATTVSAGNAANDDWAVILGQQMQLLEKNPADAAARKAAWRAAIRLGLFEQAANFSAGLDPAEQRAMAGDQIALAIRYGIIDRNTLHGANRLDRLDRAIAQTDLLASGFFTGQMPEAEDQRRLNDRLSALSMRRRSNDAVTLYQALVQGNIAVPLWAKKEVAGSYLELRQPQIAVTLYQEVVNATPDDFDANLGLFYALVDAEQIDAATAHIDQYAARLPIRRHLDGKYNSERLSVDVTSDQARTYADRLKQAEARIDSRVQAIPFNSEVRQSAASLALARGWPRLGKQRLQQVLASDPENPAIHTDLSENSLTLQDWPAARTQLNTAQLIDPEHGSVKRATRSMNLHDRNELSIESGFGRGQDSGYLGNRDWSIDSYFYSKPLAENWRAFAHNYTSSGDFDNSKTTFTRTGAGAEWRHLDWRLTGEVNGGSSVKPGVTGTATWKPSDYWAVYASGESVTNQIPVRAIRDGVNASRLALGADWRAHESRKLASGIANTDFSDGNQRTALNLSWFERWSSDPKWMFETTLGADASHNTLQQGASYFNPRNDRSLWLTGAIENLTWRNYDYSLRQRLALTGGRYWQLEQGFAPANMGAIEYGHRWEVDRDLSLRYSIGRSLRPYDGVREGRNFGTLSLLWRF